jgi:tetratricopeptide (TPR) repeat protein
MLAAMTSLALLARSHAAPVLNTTFYATAALLIPVLFLAIAVQGNAFRQVINAPGRLAADAAVTARGDLDQLDAARQNKILKLSAVWLKLEALRIAVWFLELAAFLIMAAGAIGELLAVYALYQGHDQPGVGLTVLLSAALLTCAVIIEPVQAQVSIFQEVHRRRRLRSHIKIGDVAVAAGDLAAARADYQASLDIRIGLAAADPANRWQRDLSVIHDNLGNLAMAAGDLTAARADYQASLDIRIGLAAADPANTQWQRDLSIARQRINDLPDASE